MESPWPLFYVLPATVVVLASALLTLQVWEHRRFSRSRIARYDRDFQVGRAMIAVACKGAEADLAANLRPLFEQDHPDYELVFTIETEHDPARPVIENLIASYPRRTARLIFAGLANSSGQKVHNLLAATRDLPVGIKNLVFVDVDVRPDRHWLKRIIQRLKHDSAATGYRCFVPERTTLPNLLLAGMNNVLMSMMCPGRRSLVWGGSWAIRREVFDAIDLRGAWQGTLSDDLVASRQLKRNRKRITVEPACYMAAPLNVNWEQMVEFIGRQLRIGRLYSPNVWRFALVAGVISQIAFWGSLLAVIAGLSTGAAWTKLPATLVAVLYVLSVFRALLRHDAARSLVRRERARMRAAFYFDIFCGPLISLAWCVGLIAAGFGRGIVWKGIAYQMDAHGNVLSITHPSASGPSAQQVKETTRHQAA